MHTVDYHVHTDTSFDCQTPMLDMCYNAVSIGLHEIAFTDHFNNHLLDIDLGYYNPDRFFEDIEYCRAQFPKLTIVAGVEVGEPYRWEKKIRPVLERYPYDVVLGSLHWVGRENIFSPNYFRSRSPQQAYKEYFDELLVMIDAGGFDVLAHVDLPKRTAFNIYGEFNVSQIEDSMRKVWERCIVRGIIPEINTKALRLPVHQLHPTTEALSWYVAMGGTSITIGSDAHQPESVGQGFAEAVESAQNAGIQQIVRFKNRRLVAPILLWDGAIT